MRSAKPPPGVATSRDINGDMVSLYFSLWNVPKSTAEIDRCLEPHTCLEPHCLFLSRLSMGKIAERQVRALFCSFPDHEIRETREESGAVPADQRGQAARASRCAGVPQRGKPYCSPGCAKASTQR